MALEEELGGLVKKWSMQRLLEGSLESPALKGTVYPKAAAPEERQSLQVDDVGSVLGGTGSAQSLASLCALAGAVRRGGLKGIPRTASRSSFTRMLAQAHLEQGLRHCGPSVRTEEIMGPAFDRRGTESMH